MKMAKQFFKVCGNRELNPSIVTPEEGLQLVGVIIKYLGGV